MVEKINIKEKIKSSTSIIDELIDNADSLGSKNNEQIKNSMLVLMKNLDKSIEDIKENI